MTADTEMRMPNLRHTALLALCGSTLVCLAQQPPTVLSAQESDPVKLGWMQGTPPPLPFCPDAMEHP